MADLIKRDIPRGLRRWDPFTELRQMQHDMDALFSRFFGRDISTPDLPLADWVPAVDTYMKGSDIVMKCELPGIDPRDVDVSYDESTNQLVIKGERKQEKETKEEDYVHRELAYGRFERRFMLPAGVKVDQLKAKYANGVLELTLPAAAASKPKKIQIEGAEKKAA